MLSTVKSEQCKCISMSYFCHRSGASSTQMFGCWFWDCEEVLASQVQSNILLVYLLANTELWSFTPDRHFRFQNRKQL